VPRDNEIGSNQSAPRCDESSEDRGRDGKWWVCNHPERPPRQAKVDCVGHDDGDGATSERSSQVRCPLSVELYGDDAGATFEERPDERAITGADIEDKITRSNPGIGNDLCSPAAIEVMPPPPCPLRRHDAPW
jgi:hypothetical protein